MNAICLPCPHCRTYCIHTPLGDVETGLLLIDATGKEELDPEWQGRAWKCVKCGCPHLTMWLEDTAAPPSPPATSPAAAPPEFNGEEEER